MPWRRSVPRSAAGTKQVTASNSLLATARIWVESSNGLRSARNMGERDEAGVAAHGLARPPGPSRLHSVAALLSQPHIASRRFASSRSAPISRSRRSSENISSARACLACWKVRVQHDGPGYVRARTPRSYVLGGTEPEAVDALRSTVWLARANGHTRPHDQALPEEAYDYRDAQGHLVYQVVRRFPKSFRQRRPDGRGGWIWNLDGVARVLYRLPELLKAAPHATIYIVEGEKDVDAMHGRGSMPQR